MTFKLINTSDFRIIHYIFFSNAGGEEVKFCERIKYKNFASLPAKDLRAGMSLVFQVLCAGRFRCVKSVPIRNFSGPYFPVFGLNTERCSVSLHIQSKCGKIRTRKTPNRDTLHAVSVLNKKYKFP